MADKSDLTSRQLFIAFKEAFPAVDVCISTVKRAPWMEHTRNQVLSVDLGYEQREANGLVFRTFEDE